MICSWWIHFSIWKNKLCNLGIVLQFGNKYILPAVSWFYHRRNYGLGEKGDKCQNAQAWYVLGARAQASINTNKIQIQKNKNKFKYKYTYKYKYKYKLHSGHPSVAADVGDQGSRVPNSQMAPLWENPLCNTSFDLEVAFYDTFCFLWHISFFFDQSWCAHCYIWETHCTPHVLT